MEVSPQNMPFPTSERLVFERNESVGYRLNLAKKGRYLLKFEALGGQVGPDLIDVMIDGDPRAVGLPNAVLRV